MIVINTSLNHIQEIIIAQGLQEAILDNPEVHSIDVVVSTGDTVWSTIDYG